jgi:predicted nuclease with TOPRIM domain
MGEIRHLEIDLQNDVNRSLEFYLDDNDTISFVWYENENNERTKKISIGELYSTLREVSDWKEQIKREKANSEIKGWRDKCISIEKEKTKIEEENWKLRGDLQALRETIKIVGK